MQSRLHFCRHKGRRAQAKFVLLQTVKEQEREEAGSSSSMSQEQARRAAWIRLFGSRGPRKSGRRRTANALGCRLVGFWEVGQVNGVVAPLCAVKSHVSDKHR